MGEMLERTELLLGKEAVNRLQKARVAVFGIGGVGGYVVEALVRSGVGALDLVDRDTVSVSNLNRQIIAARDTIGMRKTTAAALRARAISPEVVIREYPEFYTPETGDSFPFESFDYVVDAVDTVSAKIDIICRCDRLGVPVISCMGAGNKLHPELFEIDDIYRTSVCPLARVMRRELKARGIRKLKVVYSKEMPIDRGIRRRDESTGKVVPGSIAFVPAAAGLIAAGEVVRTLAQV